MQRPAATLLSLVLICAPRALLGFEVVSDGFAGGPKHIEIGLPSVPVTVSVQNTGAFLAWDIRIQAFEGVQLLGFTEGPGVTGNLVSATEVRANWSDPSNAQNGPQLVGTLQVSAPTEDGTVRVVVGSVFVNASVLKVTVPEVTLASTKVCSAANDSDSDGSDDCTDNCPFERNGDQNDRGGVGSFSGPDGDGIGDACQCGDVTGDGVVNSFDATMIKRHALGLSAPVFNVPELCDVTGDGACNSFDATMITRAALGLSAPLFGQNCPPANP